MYDINEGDKIEITEGIYKGTIGKVTCVDLNTYFIIRPIIK